MTQKGDIEEGPKKKEKEKITGEEPRIHEKIEPKGVTRESRKSASKIKERVKNSTFAKKLGKNYADFISRFADHILQDPESARKTLAILENEENGPLLAKIISNVAEGLWHGETGRALANMSREEFESLRRILTDDIEVVRRIDPTIPLNRPQPDERVDRKLKELERVLWGFHLSDVDPKYKDLMRDVFKVDDDPHNTIWVMAEWMTFNEIRVRRGLPEDRTVSDEIWNSRTMWYGKRWSGPLPL